MMQQVNLLVAELKPRKEALTMRQLLALWAAFGGVLVLLSSWQGVDLWQQSAEHQEKRAQWQMINSANEQLKSSITTEPDPALLGEVESLRQIQANQVQLVAVVSGYEAQTRSGFSSYLTDLARYHVRGTRLNAIELLQGGLHIHLAGETLEPGNVPALLSKLSQGPSFKGHRFDAITLEEQEPGLLRFEIVGPDAEQGG
ncbi:MAG: hypothetical protein R3E86_22375 [Pseudomonadales bacterium]